MHMKNSTPRTPSGRVQRLVLGGIALVASFYILYKLSYVYTYFVTYSARHIAPGPIRTCDKCTHSASTAIPRILHHSWKNETVPAIWKDTYQSCVEKHTDYKFMFWTDQAIDEFFRKEYQWFYSTYINYEYNIERVDAARYFILYHYGGVYIDLDVGCQMPTHEILDHTVGYKVIIPEGYPTGLTNWFMASTARHSLFRSAMMRLQRSEGFYGTSYMSIFWSTGPMFLTWCASINRDARKDLFVLPFKDLFVKYFHKAPGGSWHNGDAKLFLMLRDIGMSGWWAITLVVIALLIPLSVVIILMCRYRRPVSCCRKENGNVSVDSEPLLLSHPDHYSLRNHQ